jgi:hypothetical protein
VVTAEMDIVRHVGDRIKTMEYMKTQNDEDTSKDMREYLGVINR